MLPMHLGTSPVRDAAANRRVVLMCPIGFLADGVVIQTPSNQTGWGQHPRMGWIRFRTHAFLMEMVREFPELEFLISLSWVDLEQTYQPRNDCSEAAGQQSPNT